MAPGNKRDSNATTGNDAVVEMYCPVCDGSFASDAQHCPNDGARLVKLVEKKDSLIGRVLGGNFTVKSKLGAGGMGAVYRALQQSVGREVAIKVIEPRLANHRDVTKRFLRESQLTSKLSQPNTVTVIDFGQTDDGLLYLVMELLVGKSLEELLRAEGALSEERAIRIGVQICDALDAANTLHIVHRDLKPGNVVILDHPPGRDMVKVLDFGIAKSLAGDTGVTTMTRSDMILGTPSYIPPEAVHGAKIDGRADLYSLGIMLHEMLVGELPFDATTVNQMLAQHTSDPPKPLPDSIRPSLRAIIAKLLQKRPDDRYASAAEARAALTAAARNNSRNSSALAATVDPTLPPGMTPIASSAPSMPGVPAPWSGTTSPPVASTGQNVRGAAPTPAPLASHTPWTGEHGQPGKGKGLWIVLALLVLGGGAAAAVVLGASDEAAQDGAGDGDTSAVASPADGVASSADAGAEPKASEKPPVAKPAGVAVPNDKPTPAKERDPALIYFKLDSIPRGAKVTLRRVDEKDVVLCPSTPCLEVTFPKVAQYGDVVFEREGRMPWTQPNVDLLGGSQSLRPKLRVPPPPKPEKRTAGRVKPPRKPPPKTEKDEQFIRARQPGSDEGFIRKKPRRNR